jgi:hypothetical protein
LIGVASVNPLGGDLGLSALVGKEILSLPLTDKSRLTRASWSITATVTQNQDDDE